MNSAPVVGLSLAVAMVALSCTRLSGAGPETAPDAEDSVSGEPTDAGDPQDDDAPGELGDDAPTDGPQDALGDPPDASDEPDGEAADVDGVDAPEWLRGACFNEERVPWPPTDPTVACVAGCGDDPVCESACLTDQAVSRSCGRCRRALADCVEASCAGCVDCGDCVAAACLPDWRACAGDPFAVPVADPPAVERGCGAFADQIAATDPAVEQTLAACAAACGSAVGPTCGQECLAAGAELSLGCAGCFTDYLACLPAICYSACRDLPFSPGCEGCARDLCRAELESCVGFAPDAAWYPEVATALVQLVSADPDVPIMTLADGATGSPLLRVTEAFAASAQVPVDAAIRRWWLLGGVFGPGVLPYGDVFFDLTAGGAYVMIGAPDPESSGPSLRIVGWPPTPPLLARVVVHSAVRSGTLLVEDITEAVEVTVVETLEPGATSAPYLVPAGTFVVRVTRNGVAWEGRLAALAAGIDTLLVIGAANPDVTLLVVQSTGSAFSVSLIPG